MKHVLRRVSLCAVGGLLVSVAVSRPALAAVPCGDGLQPMFRPAAGAVRADSTLGALHASGQTFTDFVAAAKARREGWVKLADSAEVAAPVAARAKAAAAGGSWRLLVVAIDACGDSMNTVPYVAKVAALAGVDLRIVLPSVGRPVQESHRSLDGRVATPTFVLIDAAGNERGCIVEQPRALREWSAPARSAVSIDSVHAGIRAFYAADKGAAIAMETAEMLEAARAGRTHCDRGTAR
ncbi:thioredoxin family protein [Gemmatimonas sp.]|uniref:thioredoxin family protein n=1 Tax=Gemmatimonas sp. TaxID=1962908 RepID=UPI003341AC64